MVSGLFSAIVLVSWKCYMMIQYCASQVGRVKPWKEYLYDRNWQTLLTTSWFFFFLFGCLSRLKKITEKMSMIQIKHNSMSYPRLPDCKYWKNEETVFYYWKPTCDSAVTHVIEEQVDFFRARPKKNQDAQLNLTFKSTDSLSNQRSWHLVPSFHGK